MVMTEHAATGNRGYLAVFAALLVLTVATVTASSLAVSAVTAIAIGLAIAALKAALVAVFFMHLRQERGLVHVALAFTAVCCAGLFVLTLLTEADHAPGTRFGSAFDSPTR